MVFDPLAGIREQLLDDRVFSEADLCAAQPLPKPTLSRWFFSAPSISPSTRLDAVSTTSKFKEVEIANTNHTSASSASILRQPTTIDDFHLGSVQSKPFKPGGMDNKDLDAVRNLAQDVPNARLPSIPTPPPLNAFGLFCVAPGLESGLTATIDDSTRISDAIAPYLRFLPKPKTSDEPDSRIQPKAIGLQDATFGNLALEGLFGGKDNDLLGLNDQTEYNHDQDGEKQRKTDSKNNEKNGKTKQDAADVDTSTTNDDNGKPSLERRPSFGELMSKLNEFQAWRGKAAQAPASSAAVIEWAVEDNSDVSQFHSQVPSLAHSYPFELDTFQKQAVLHMEQGDCVFVAAHTSAGKTVVAEYAIALAMKHMTRAVYTSPIKTLSNQKFREFKSTFGDVGIMTGDMNINPDASCLILTTEILRSMLYRGADLIRDIEWVIFDEVHYVNDLERGVVWEETIIMLPEHVKIVLLSASVPNTMEFADWVGRTKQKKVYVVKTAYRPVPLEHALYVNKKIFTIMEENGNFKSVGYQQACNALKEQIQGPKASAPGQGPNNSNNNNRGGNFIKSNPKLARSLWTELVKELEKNSILPVVCFTFSKKRCEETVDYLSNLDLITHNQKSEVHVFFNNSISRLSEADRTLPQVMRMKEMLTRGLGVHHAGLLPLMKEIVEILFSRGLVKVLFATETFAMGVNMPARTVVFNGVRKHDGQQFRELTPSEYQQMSGRAGRRGIDKKGLVLIVAWDEPPPEHVLQTMMRGKPTKLESQFRLTYNMIVNLLRVEDFKVEDILKRSFSEVHSQRMLPSKAELVVLSKEHMKTMAKLDCLQGEPAIEEYHEMFREAEKKFLEARREMAKSHVIWTYLDKPQLVLVETKAFGHSLGMTAEIVKPSEAYPLGRIQVFAVSTEAYNNVLPLGSKFGQKHLLVNRLSSQEVLQQGVFQGIPYQLVRGDLSNIRGFCAEKLKTDVNKLRNLQNQTIASVVAKIGNMMRENPREPKLLDERRDLKISDLDFVEAHEAWLVLMQTSNTSKCLDCPKLVEQFEQAAKRADFKDRVDELSVALSDQSLNLLPQLLSRSMVLEMLGYIDADRTVLLKGRVACEIHSVDELLTTEMIFDNAFTELECEEIAALLSTMLCKEKDDNDVLLTDSLRKAYDHMKLMARDLAQLQFDSGVADVEPDEAARKLNPALMQVVYEWVQGEPFSKIVTATSIAEGSIVRTITRLDVTCGEIKSAARAIGNATLFQKMEIISQRMKRDIVFAASLYVQ